MVVVKPKWLCSTFAFHPMLGFRRHKQAANIAHGCASTFQSLHGVAQKHREWVDGWKMSAAIAKIRLESVVPRLAPQPAETTGDCWFRHGVPCPFSAAALEEAGVTDPTSIREVSKIYDACGKWETHNPDEPRPKQKKTPATKPRPSATMR